MKCIKSQTDVIVTLYEIRKECNLKGKEPMHVRTSKNKNVLNEASEMTFYQGKHHYITAPDFFSQGIRTIFLR